MFGYEAQTWRLSLLIKTEPVSAGMLTISTTVKIIPKKHIYSLFQKYLPDFRDKARWEFANSVKFATS
jgi:hypothetical protein